MSCAVKRRKGKTTDGCEDGEALSSVRTLDRESDHHIAPTHTERGLPYLTLPPHTHTLKHTRTHSHLTSACGQEPFSSAASAAAPAPLPAGSTASVVCSAVCGASACSRGEMATGEMEATLRKISPIPLLKPFACGAAGQRHGQRHGPACRLHLGASGGCLFARLTSHCLSLSPASRLPLICLSVHFNLGSISSSPRLARTSRSRHIGPYSPSS